MKKFISVLIINSLLMGCASVTVLKSGYSATSPEHIQVIIDNDDSSSLPQCKAEQIGYISTPYQWTVNSAINTAKEKAAKIGGDYIKATVRVNDWNDGQVNAVVYKCLSN